MFTKKCLVSFVLILSLCFSVLVPVIASPDTVQEKADVLNQLTILRGSNGDYKLEDQLRRSEAAAFIVRLMGKEGHIEENESQYRQTTYPDVDTSDWYAPYVEYCSTKGIITGGTDGNFNPNGFINERSFLKIALCALGYVYNEDFTWQEVYGKAYDVGLVTDYSYTYKTDDNSSYKREDVVGVLYNALTLENVNTGEEMFYMLIDEGIISSRDAQDAGFINDETPTRIDDVTVIDMKRVSITFNEEIADIDEDNITIYETHDFTEKLDVEIDSWDDYKIVVKTSLQSSGVDYTIEIDEIEDMEGNISSIVSGTFTGYETENVESEFFKISSIEPVNEKAVKVYFTHPVNINSEIDKYYIIEEDGYTFADGASGQITVKMLASVDNGIIISLDRDYFKDDTVYILEIDGDLTSAYGVKLNDGNGDSMTFTATSEKSEKFKLEDLIPYDNETLLLNFNKEISTTLAEKTYFYQITDEDDKIVKIEKVTIETIGKRKGKELFINIEGTFTKNDTYTLIINHLTDITGNESISEETYTFKADYGSKEEMEIDDVDAIDNRTLEVYFSVPPDKETAVNTSYYSIRGASSGYSYSAKPEKVYYDPLNHPYMVKLFLSEDDTLRRKREYELRVDNSMKDYMGNSIERGSKDKFDGTDDEKEAPAIQSAAAISSDAVKLEFDNEIAYDIHNIDTSNYILEYMSNGRQIKKVPLSIIYVNECTLVLKFDKLEPELEYTISYTTIMDYSGTEVKPEDNEDRHVKFMLVEQ